MKIPPQRLEHFLGAPDRDIRAVLVYGPDAGLVRERSERLAKGVVADLNDPFRIADIQASSLRDDPAKLSDEAAAIAMTGGRRVVRVRDAGDSASKILDAFLSAPAGDALIVVESSELGPRSSLRKLFEAAANAAALPCYADDGANLGGVIRDSLAGFTLEPDALQYLISHLGGDRLATRAELEKLAVYMGQPGRIRLEDATACIGDGTALSQDDLVLAAADGDHAGVQRMLDRLLREGVSPVAILRALARHLQRLHLVAGLTAQGMSADQALSGLRPPFHFRAAARVRKQLTRWPADRLATALELTQTAEMNCKTTGLPANEICDRLVFRIAAAASAGRR